MQPPNIPVREVGYRAGRIDPGNVQRLTGVDIPDARNPGLVHQRILDRCAAPPESVTEVDGSESGIERLRAET